MKKNLIIMAVGLMCLYVGTANGVIDYSQPLALDSQTIALWHMDVITRNTSSSRVNDASAANDRWLMIRTTTSADSTTLGSLVSGPTTALGKALYFDNGVVGSGGDTMYGATRLSAVWNNYETVKIESWIKVDALGDMQWIAENDYAWSVRIEGSTLRFRPYFSDATGRNLDIPITGHANEWLHFVASFDDAGHSFFEVKNLAGDFYASVSADDPGKVLYPYVGKIIVGSDSGSKRYFTGAIDDLRVSTAIPEPATLILMGISGLFLTGRKSK